MNAWIHTRSQRKKSKKKKKNFILEESIKNSTWCWVSKYPDNTGLCLNDLVFHLVHGNKPLRKFETVLVLSLKESAQHRSLSELFGIPSDSWKWTPEKILTLFSNLTLTTKRIDKNANQYAWQCAICSMGPTYVHLTFQEDDVVMPNVCSLGWNVV